MITTGIEQENLVLSVQVLGEFFNVVTRRTPQPVRSDEAREVIASIGILPVQEIDLAMVNRAIDVHKKYQLAYWDALSFEFLSGRDVMALFLVSICTVRHGIRSCVNERLHRAVHILWGGGP